MPTGTGSYTVSAWFKTTDTSGVKDIIVWGNPSSSEATGLAVNGNDQARFIMYGNDFDASVTGITDGSWHHLVGVHNSSVPEGNFNVDLYYDGSRKGVAERSPNIGSDDASIGNNPWFSTDWFNGEIDEVQVYDRALSGSEVEELYFQGSDGTFNGEYTSRVIDARQLTDWVSATVNADVPAGTSAELVFESLDSSNNVVDTYAVDLDDGDNVYSLSVSNSERARFRLSGSSDSPSTTWSVDSIDIEGDSSVSDGLTKDNYTSTEWENTTQPVKIECNTGVSDCHDIDWRIVKNGNTLRTDPDGAPERTKTVDVGSENEGLLVLEYRGRSPSDSPEEWKRQSVKVDKTPPDTQITSPNTDSWYDDDITVEVNDEDVISESDVVELKYLVDTSLSLETGVWQDLVESVDEIESDIENDMGINVEHEIIAANNSYHDDPDAADSGVQPFHCASGQTSPRQSIGPVNGEIQCSEYWDEIDRISNTRPYIEWLNENQGTSYTVSSFEAKDRVEPPSEGWGMSILDVIERGDWIGGVDRFVIPVTDQDSNGGNAGPSCDDDVSQDLASDLVDLTDVHDIDVIGLVSEQECANNAAVDQLNLVGNAIEYENQGEFESFVKDNVNGTIGGTCQYRVREQGGSWSSWNSRDCPDGSFDVTIGEDSVNDCTTGGKDACTVQVRAIDKAGNIARDTARYNIGLSGRGGPPGFNVDTNFPEDSSESYSAFITTSEHPDLMPIKIVNEGGIAQDFVTSIEGDDVELQTGGTETEYSLGPGETETILLKVGTPLGKREVTVTTESRTLGITKSRKIDVYVRDHEIDSDREVTGLEGLHVAALGISSIVAYSLLL